jgi:hypothetical protein
MQERRVKRICLYLPIHKGVDNDKLNSLALARLTIGVQTSAKVERLPYNFLRYQT